MHPSQLFWLWLTSSEYRLMRKAYQSIQKKQANYQQCCAGKPSSHAMCNEIGRGGESQEILGLPRP
jgi:hypothetical protein